MVVEGLPAGGTDWSEPHACSSVGASASCIRCHARQRCSAAEPPSSLKPSAPATPDPTPDRHTLLSAGAAPPVQSRLIEGRTSETASPASSTPEAVCVYTVWPAVWPCAACHVTLCTPTLAKSPEPPSSKCSRAAGTCGGGGRWVQATLCGAAGRWVCSAAQHAQRQLWGCCCCCYATAAPGCALRCGASDTRPFTCLPGCMPAERACFTVVLSYSVPGRTLKGCGMSMPTAIMARCSRFSGGQYSASPVRYGASRACATTGASG